MKKSQLIIALALFPIAIMAQENPSIKVTTAIGTTKIQGQLGQILKPAIAFNSGFELELKNHWFVQGKLSFNTLAYNQKYRDETSKYLFTNTNSSLIQLGVLGGKDFSIVKEKLLIGPYAGLGFLNIGEPRLLVDVNNTSVKQEVLRNSNIYGNIGTRLSLVTKPPFLQMIFLDASYFASPQRIQQEKLNGLSLFIGTKFSMK